MSFHNPYTYSTHYAPAPSAPTPQYAHDVDMVDASGTRYESRPPLAVYGGERVPGRNDHRAAQHMYGMNQPRVERNNMPMTPTDPYRESVQRHNEQFVPLWSSTPRHPPGLQRPGSPGSRWTPSAMYYGSNNPHRDFDADFLFDSIGDVPMGDHSHDSQPSRTPRRRAPPAYSELDSTARSSGQTSQSRASYRSGMLANFNPDQEFIPIPAINPNELVNTPRSAHRRGNPLSVPPHVEHHRGPATQRRNRSKRERDTPHPSAGILSRSQDILINPMRSALAHLYPLVPSQMPAHLILDITDDDKLYHMSDVGSANAVFTAAQEEGNFFAYHRLRNALITTEYTSKVFASDELRTYLMRNNSKFTRAGLYRLNQLRELGSHSHIDWVRKLSFRRLSEHGVNGSALPPCPPAPYRAPSCAKGNDANFTTFVNHTLIHGAGTAMNAVLFTEDRIDPHTLLGAFYERQLIPNGGETRHKPSTDKARIFYACLTSYPPIYDRLRNDHGIVVNNRVDYTPLDTNSLPNLTLLDMVRELARRGWTTEMLSFSQPWGIYFLQWAAHPKNKLAREIREVANEGLLLFAIEVQVNGLPRRWDEVQTHGASRLPPDLFSIPATINFDQEVYKQRRLRLTLGYPTRNNTAPVVGTHAPVPVPPPIIAQAGPSITPVNATASHTSSSSPGDTITRPASAPAAPPSHPNSDRDDGNDDASMADSESDSGSGDPL